MWSLLPDDVLGIIKDGLDIFDNASVNSVCRNWWLASENYPERQTVGDGFPWIMQAGFFRSNTLEVISITRKKKITVELPNFCRGKILFSKQGWVLIHLCKNTRPYQGMPHQLFLLNPLTKAIIELPQYVPQYVTVPHRSVYYASFSIDNGRPHRVVLCVPECGFHYPFLALYTAQVGDEMWMDHSYRLQNLHPYEPLIGLLVIGQAIYCCYLYGKMVIYDVETQVWKEVMERPVEIKNFPRTFYVEYDGQVVLYVSNNNLLSDSDLFYSYSNSCEAWNRLSDDFKNDKGIFFHRYIGSFICTGQDCFKVYNDSALEDYLVDVSKDGLVLVDREDLDKTWVDIG